MKTKSMLPKQKTVKTSMDDTNRIFRIAQKIVQKTGTRDPFAAAKFCGVEIMRADYFTKLLGMYMICLQHRVIFLNTKADLFLQRTVCAHELGHDMLHRAQARSHALCELTLFREKTVMEYQANAFAAHFLIDTQESLEAAQCGMCISQMAGMFGVEEELVLIKLQELQRLGYPLRIPREPNGAFLKKAMLAPDNRVGGYPLVE